MLGQLLRYDPFIVYTECPRCSTSHSSSWVGQKPSSRMWSPRLLSLPLPSHFILGLGRGGEESCCTHMQLHVQPKTIGGPVQISGVSFWGALYSPLSLLEFWRIYSTHWDWSTLCEFSFLMLPSEEDLPAGNWSGHEDHLLSLSSESTVVNSVSSSISTQSFLSVLCSFLIVCGKSLYCVIMAPTTIASIPSWADASYIYCCSNLFQALWVSGFRAQTWACATRHKGIDRLLLQVFMRLIFVCFTFCGWSPES